MKNTFPVLVYEDIKFKETTKSEIEGAKIALQNLLNEWNGLKLPAITDYKQLFRVIHTPQRVYSETYHALNPEPVYGALTIRPGVSINLTDVPLPNELYIKARSAQREIQTGRLELWTIEDEKIVLNEIAAKTHLNSADIYAENEAQKMFVEACLMFVESSDTLITSLTNMPSTRLPMTPFSIIERTGFLFLSRVKLDPDQMRELLKSL
jgi:hypothetical protein